MKKEERVWKIYYWRFDPKGGMAFDQGSRTKEYKRYGNALNAGHKLFDNTDFSWIVSNVNPFIKTCEVCKKTFMIDTPMCRPSYMQITINKSKKYGDRTHYYISTMCPECATKLRAAMVKQVMEIQEEAKDGIL